MRPVRKADKLTNFLCRCREIWEAAILGDRNVIKKEAEKILKYKDLTIEIKSMWKLKTRRPNTKFLA